MASEIGQEEPTAEKLPNDKIEKYAQNLTSEFVDALIENPDFTRAITSTFLFGPRGDVGGVDFSKGKVFFKTGGKEYREYYVEYDPDAEHFAMYIGGPNIHRASNKLEPGESYIALYHPQNPQLNASPHLWYSSPDFPGDHVNTSFALDKIQKALEELKGSSQPSSPKTSSAA